MLKIMHRLFSVLANPLVHAYMATYGLVGTLLIATLVNSSVLIFSGLFFTLYRMVQRRYNWHSPLIDAIAYSLVATFGLYALITWLLNAAKDVYVLLFHSCHDVISNLWRFWQNMTLYIVLAMFLVLFLFLYVSLLLHAIDRTERTGLVLYRGFFHIFFIVSPLYSIQRIREKEVIC